jgi:two-component system KDP operon response regulator KdpE
MSGSPPTVLVIEDEPQMRRFLRSALEGNGYRVVEVATAREGLAQAAGRNPDVILLDLGLPDADGLDVTRRLREWAATPVIVISARGLEKDKIGALDAGADDYLTKPFSVGELLARVRAMLRRAHAEPAAPAVLRVGELAFDRERRQLAVDGRLVHLTPLEYRLFERLARVAGKVVTHRQLLADVWGGDQVDQLHYLRIYMGHLRAKVERDPADPRYLLTELGVGYRLADE